MSLAEGICGDLDFEQISLLDEICFDLFQGWGIGQQMRVSFVVALRHTTAQTAQAARAVHRNSSLLKRLPKLADGKTVIVQQHIKVEPVSGLRTLGRNQAFCFEQLLQR